MLKEHNYIPLQKQHMFPFSPYDFVTLNKDILFLDPNPNYLGLENIEDPEERFLEALKRPLQGEDSILVSDNSTEGIFNSNYVKKKILESVFFPPRILVSTDSLNKVDASGLSLQLSGSPPDTKLIVKKGNFFLNGIYVEMKEDFVFYNDNTSAEEVESSFLFSEDYENYTPSDNFEDIMVFMGLNLFKHIETNERGYRPYIMRMATFINIPSIFQKLLFSNFLLCIGTARLLYNSSQGKFYFDEVSYEKEISGDFTYKRKDYMYPYIYKNLIIDESDYTLQNIGSLSVDGGDLSL